ncbi:MAG: hypothetical protein ABIQ77_10165 [Anaerolineales bacterium]
MQHTTTQPRIAAITQPTDVKRSTFVIALAVFGVMSILLGLINLFSANIGLSKASMPSLVNTILIGVAFDFILGALIITSSGALAQGRMLAIWLYGGSILLNICFNLAMGQPLNYLFIGFGLLLIWQIAKYRQNLRLL